MKKFFYFPLYDFQFTFNPLAFIKKITAQNVESIFLDCLFQKGEDVSTAKIVEGIVNKLD